ncbi:hypothetical protein BCR42DRAFT_429199 [Absidia repens]|uniref:Uncharacterized protein n=1 Tax=Absidia repens TaxID=90262 RepID=A0A1X2HXB2_9FUNG|nr:hypothetical protein BCR42DRAFT_429199 [Absidia repens]
MTVVAVVGIVVSVAIIITIVELSLFVVIRIIIIFFCAVVAAVICIAIIITEGDCRICHLSSSTHIKYAVIHHDPTIVP